MLEMWRARTVLLAVCWRLFQFMLSLTRASWSRISWVGTGEYVVERLLFELLLVVELVVTHRDLPHPILTGTFSNGLKNAPSSLPST